MNKAMSRRLAVLSAAAAAVAMAGAAASAQNIIINDNFDDGNLLTNTLGVGSGFSPSNTFGAGVEVDGAFRTDTSTGGNFGLQAISSRDGFDFWNSGGALVQWTTGSVTSTLDANQNLLAFPGGTSADWRHELGVVNFRRNNLDNVPDEFWRLDGIGSNQAGFYINLFYDQAGSGNGNDLLVTGNIRAANKDKAANVDFPGPGAEVIATFTFNLYQGQTDLVTSLSMNDIGFSLSFSENATFSIEPFMGPSFQVQNGSLVGNWADMGEAPFTDEFINPFGHDAFVTAQGQNLGAGRGMGSVKHILVDAAQLSEPSVTEWIAGTGNWDNAANWSAGKPIPERMGVVNNGGTVQLNTAEATSWFDLGTSDGGSGSLQVSSGGTLTLTEGLRIGQMPGSEGHVTMTGGSVNVTAGFNHVLVGDNGTGTMVMSGDSATSSAHFIVGLQPTSVGSLTMSDSASVTTVNGNFEVGFIGGSVGSVVMNDNSSINVTGTGARVFRVGDRGTGTLEMNGGSILAGVLIIGDARGSGTGSGHMILNDGTVTLDRGDRVIIGFGRSTVTGARSEGTLTMTGGTLDILPGALTFPDMVIGWDGIGTLNLSGGTINVTGVVATGVATGSGEALKAEGYINHSGGTINTLGMLLGERGIGEYNLSGTGEVNVRDRIRLAASSATGEMTFTQSGGVVNSGTNPVHPFDFNSLIIGQFGQGTYTISSGELNVRGRAWIGDFPGSRGWMNVDGGTVNVTDDMRVALQGRSTLNQTAGVLNVGGIMHLGSGHLAANALGDVNLSGGTMNVGNAINVGLNNGNGILNVSGGALAVTNAIRVWSTGVMNYSGGTVSAGTLEVNGATPAGPGGRVYFSPGAGVSMAVNALAIDAAGGAIVDLADNELVVRNGDANAVSAVVASGYAGGSWNGTGIQSSVAAAESGRALGIGMQGNDVVVGFTWGGDATMDGSVTIADLGVLAANWQASDRLWFHGDFNYDGSVNIADLGILAGNWQKGPGGSGMSFAEELAMFDVFDGVVVPEPAALGLVGLGVLGLRRRRQARFVA
jgi:hypothetical protein